MTANRLIRCAGLGACVALGIACAEGAVQNKKVLIIGIDGVRPDVLAGVPTPNLDDLIARGAYSDRALTGLPTVSGPGWSSMLIGVTPDKHGVTSNDFTSNRYGDYPDVLSRVESIRPELNTFVVADWMPLVRAVDGGPLIGEAPDVKVAFDGYELGWPEADELSVDTAVTYLRSADPDLAFVYIGSPDETSHETGSIGEPYREAIAAADVLVGRLVAAVEARPTYQTEDWLILVSTDHGRREDGGHGGETIEERTIFFLASGPSVQIGMLSGTPAIADVAVTALAHLGIEIDEAWGLDGRVVGLRSR